jgi:DNA-binding NarL/FixJ family response regulator
MGVNRGDRRDVHDHVLLLAGADGAMRRAMKRRLAHVPGRAGEPGRHPRFRVVVASSGAEALERAAGATIAAVDLALPRGPGLETVRRLREAYPALAILAYAAAAGGSDAMASVMAGADFFHEWGDGADGSLEHAVELAVDRRTLTRTIERSEAEMETARGRLARLTGDVVGALPGLRPVHARDDVIPFREAARRYLLAAAQLYARDPAGLAEALGVSYFALRRLLARYDVAFPTARKRARRAAP